MKSYTIEEAKELLKNGHMVRRPTWGKNEFIRKSSAGENDWIVRNSKTKNIHPFASNTPPSRMPKDWQDGGFISMHDFKNLGDVIKWSGAKNPIYICSYGNVQYYLDETGKVFSRAANGNYRKRFNTPVKTSDRAYIKESVFEALDKLGLVKE